MGGWSGVVLALGGAGDDSLGSRLPTYLHPLSGRPLAWHAVRAVSALGGGSLHVLTRPEAGADRLGDLPAGTHVVESVSAALDWLGEASREGRLLAVDALAPTLGEELARLVAADGDTLLAGGDGEILAAWLGPEGAAALVAGGGELGALAGALPAAVRQVEPALFAVRSRAALARASAAIRDRTVRRLMAGGATFLLPDTVLVDAGVEIGRDSVIYPGVVLEGDTTIGAETVIGPCCRIIGSRIGSGVELKGFNYISRTTIRNRAILEAYVRRGYDE
jgi:bifunctional N-acetylglucosamine-1-phosphate-uridyltransferase/glucosamine-1-phosphate-acetyltransferase GlmU-like protein